MISADLLILFSDIDGLFTKNPKVYSDAKKIDVVEKIDDTILEMVGSVTSNVGTGGMQTKIDAAVISTMSGCNMIICNSNRIKDLLKIASGDDIGTLFKASKKSISSREHWLIFKANSSGTIVIDDGCCSALNDKKVSILPKGVIDVKGEFLSGAIIDIRNKNNELIAKGVTNYSNTDILRIMGQETKNIDDVLGHHGKKEIIHANDLVVVKENYYGRFTK